MTTTNIQKPKGCTFPIHSRGNGFWWATDSTLDHGDMDLHNHEDWMDPEIQVGMGGTFVDCGAFIGVHAIHVAKRRLARSIAFEPAPRHVQLIEWNAEINDVEVDVRRKALGSRVMRETFQEKAGGSCVVREGINPMPASEYEVDVTTLDHELLDEERIDVIKIDVEGYECEVLKGSVAIAKKFKPKFVVEVHGMFHNCTHNGNIIHAWCLANHFAHKRIFDNGNGHFFLVLWPTW